ncbi:MAG: D-alanine-D-alanine ligase [Acidobacteriota bacterium]|nr:D-alanine-D-alanine ligase [Acidobacteriota bacterium]
MSFIRIVIAHNPVGEEDDPSTSDVLAQVELVESALGELGLPSARIAVDPSRTLEIFRGLPGSLIFNLIESPPGRPYIHTDSTAVLELAGLSYTGSSPAALALTTDKIATRALLASEGVAVAPGGRLDLERPELLDRVPPPWILKPAWEDASIGLEGDPVCATREAALERGAGLAHRFPDQPVLVERFLPGREFNVSLLANGHAGHAGDTVEVLPIAEMLYDGFPEGMSRVLGYDAKWDESSFAYIHSVRGFPEEIPVLGKVREMALKAWRLCGLGGYARIDFRLDENGVPHVLEVNANPCLAANAGFMAAAGIAGLSPGEVVRRILEVARKPLTPVPSPIAHPSPGRGAPPPVTVRRSLESGDRAPLEKLICETAFFNAEEVAVALELIDDRLSEGEASHYRFLVAETDGEVAGYACWGPIPGTLASADLYWIVVDPRHQGKGIGAALLKDAEDWMASAGRTRVYVETSTRAQYDGTRRFYFACGYELAAELDDFYGPGDGKALFLKVMT